MAFFSEGKQRWFELQATRYQWASNVRYTELSTAEDLLNGSDDDVDLDVPQLVHEVPNPHTPAPGTPGQPSPGTPTNLLQPFATQRTEDAGEPSPSTPVLPFTAPSVHWQVDVYVPPTDTRQPSLELAFPPPPPGGAPPTPELARPVPKPSCAPKRKLPLPRPAVLRAVEAVTRRPKLKASLSPCQVQALAGRSTTGTWLGKPILITVWTLYEFVLY